MWCTRDNSYTVVDIELRHLHRDGQVACTIINTGQDMTVEIDHGREPGSLTINL
jgi:hypothetical protein